MNYNQKLEKIIEYIRSGERSRDHYKVGFESEHFIVDRNTIETVSYDGENGVRSSLTDLENLGFRPSYEGEFIMGLESDEISISIEPGSQFEVAVDSRASVDELFNNYKKAMEVIVAVFNNKNQLIMQTGYQPKSSIDDIEFIPKKRYKYMSEYFLENGGKSPFNMMKGSGSLQVAIDFTDEADFAKKYFLANALSTFLYTSFDNSYIFEGKPYEKHNLRQWIWDYCDPNRSGIYPFSFDSNLSYEKYAAQILNTHSIFIRKDGEDVYTGTTKFFDIFDDDSSNSMVEHALSIVFPDVRVKRYIEIRMPDNVPYPYNFAAVALIKNIFYDDTVFNYVYDLFSDMTFDKAQNLKAKAAENGIKTLYKDKKISEWMLDIIDKISDDRKYIDPLIDLLIKDMTPRDLYKSLYMVDQQMAAYEFSVNKFVRDINGED